jgi:hypothetical protein
MPNILTFIITLAGAIVGGLIAGYYSLRATREAHRHQKILAEENEKLIISSLLQALHDELETVFDRYQEGMGHRVESLGDQQPLAFYYPLVSDFFTVYHGNSFLLGRIKDNDLRKNIIKTYTLAKGMVDSFRMNNDLVQKVEHWESIYAETQLTAHLHKYQVQYQSLIDYAKTLKEMHYDLKNNVKSTIRMLMKHGVLSEKMFN